jgi:phosphoglycolate phosphatase/putative hydrolase of the HAD superfamily
MVTTLWEIEQKKAFIFDVDGTLYSQKKMRMRMLFYLGRYYSTHLWRMKELVYLYKFRKLREEDKYKKMTMLELEDIVAEMEGTDRDKVERCIDFWMLEFPLNFIKRCIYPEIKTFINELKLQGKEIYIYSDYPADKKINALGISYTDIFSAEDAPINELKPSKKAMEYILERIGYPAKDVLYVGDREEKDGQSAKLVYMDYCDIKRLITLLKTEGENG